MTDALRILEVILANLSTTWGMSEAEFIAGCQAWEDSAGKQGIDPNELNARSWLGVKGARDVMRVQVAAEADAVAPEVKAAAALINDADWAKLSAARGIS